MTNIEEHDTLTAFLPLCMLGLYTLHTHFFLFATQKQY